MNYTAQIESYILNYLSEIRRPWLVLIGWAVLSSLVGFIAMGLDKSYAQYGQWRTSERFLLKIAFAGGCWGVLGGMIIFRHKTSKPIFFIFVMGATLLWYFIFREAFVYLGPPI